MLNFTSYSTINIRTLNTVFWDRIKVLTVFDLPLVVLYYLHFEKQTEIFYNFEKCTAAIEIYFILKRFQAEWDKENIVKF